MANKRNNANKRVYEVTCTRVCNGVIYIKAENEKEALDIARSNFDSVSFSFGEVTADYATLANVSDASDITIY